MTDTVEQFHHSIIQHGSLNDRVYIMKLDKRDFPKIFDYVQRLAEKKQYSKIFAKVPSWALNFAMDKNYICEAVIPGFFNGLIDGYFLSKYIDESRKRINDENERKINQVKQIAQKYKTNSASSLLPKNVSIKQLRKKDLDSLASIYKAVFTSYPFPIHRLSYLEKMIGNDVKYYGIFEQGQLVAASAAEMNKDQSHVEMTDFATIPEARGNNYAYFLLNYMEKQMKKEKMITAYTIARALSYGMNITFTKSSYHYAGLLRNNTAIGGSIESMNVYYKKITC